MKTILFQGDSITDCGRKDDMGMGYPLLVSAELGLEKPTEYAFINKGISGNRIVDVYARIKADIINLKPDVMSILIGVNDVCHEFALQNGVEAEKFYKIYCMLIEEIKQALPEIKIMLLEPFVLPGKCNEGEYNEWRAEVIKRAEKVRLVAEKYGLPFIPLQDKFDAACKNAPAVCWLRDGVHPTPIGHELIKREWIKTFNTL